MSEKYEFIDVEKATETPGGAGKYSITKMCEWLEVSTSGYYEWRDRAPSVTAARRERLMLLIEKAFDDSDATYGYRRVHAQLARWGERCTPELVRQVMRALGLLPCQPRPWRHSLTEADARPAPIPDLLRRDFTAAEPGTKLVTLRTFRRGRAGRSWPRSSTATTRRSSAGPSTTITGHR